MATPTRPKTGWWAWVILSLIGGYVLFILVGLAVVGMPPPGPPRSVKDAAIQFIEQGGDDVDASTVVSDPQTDGSWIVTADARHRGSTSTFHYRVVVRSENGFHIVGSTVR